MKISITGFRKVDFKPENRDDNITGTSIYYCYEDDYVQGIATGKLFLPASRSNPFEIGKTYNASINRGRIDWDSVSICEL